MHRLCCWSQRYPKSKKKAMENIPAECKEPWVDAQDINVRFEQSTGGMAMEDLFYELIQRILVFVPDQDLKECRRVCKRWREAATEQSFWKQKCIMGGKFIQKYMAPYYPSDWKEFYFKSPFSRNLIKNCSGEDSKGSTDMRGWEVLSNGGEGWKVEKDQAGADKLPEEVLPLTGGVRKNFVTSYGWCEREQVIDLLKEGFSEAMLDELRPTIFVSEWYAARFDCGNHYEFGVDLLTGRPTSENAEEVILDTFKFGPVITPEWPERTWKQATHHFKGYGPGLRFIRYWDKSKDNKWWAGFYGGKMAGSEVRFVFQDKQSSTESGAAASS